MTGAFAVAAKSFASTNDELRRLSLITGITQEEISNLGYAAKIADVDFGELTRGLKLFVVNLSKTGGEAKKIDEALKDIGIDPTAFKGLDTSAKLKQFSDAISGVEDATKRARAAAVIFGADAGPNLLSFLSLGSEGIDKLAKEANRLGVTFTPAQAALADKLGDSFDRLTATFAGLKNAIAAAISGPLTSFIDMVTNVVSNVTKWVSLNPSIIQGVADVAAAAVAAGTAVYGLGKALEYTGLLFSPGGLLFGGAALFLYMSGALDGVISSVSEAVSSFELMGRTLGEWATSVQPVFVALQETIVTIAQSVAGLFSGTFDDALPAAKSFISALTAQFNAMVSNVLDKVAQEVRNIIASIQGNAPQAYQQSITAFQADQSAQQAWDEAQQQLKSAGARIRDRISNTADEVKNALTDSRLPDALNTVINDFVEQTKKDSDPSKIGNIFKGLTEAFADVSTNVEPVTAPTTPDTATKATLSESVIGTFSSVAAGLIGRDLNASKVQKDQLNVMKQIENNTRKQFVPAIG